MYCHKQPFDTRSEAEKVLKSVQKRKNNKQKPKRAYKCDACQKWHITSDR